MRKNALKTSACNNFQYSVMYVMV